MKQHQSPIRHLMMLTVAVMFSVAGCNIAVPGSGSLVSGASPSVQQQVEDGMLTLHLDVVKGPFTLPPASDLPPGTVEVKVPLHPDAKATEQPFPMARRDQPRSPYLKGAASSVYVLPLSESSAQAWYRDAMSKAGYVQQGSGRSGNAKTGEHVESLDFVSSKADGPRVQISFQEVKPNQTLVTYWAYVITQPPRPQNTQLPTAMAKVNIIYRPWQQNATPKQKTITDPTVLKNLVADINSLPLDTAGVRSCAMDFGQGADLHFADSTGKQYDVRVHPACGDVSINKGRALFDVNSRVWNAVTAIFQSS